MKVVPHGVAFKALKVTIHGYFPIFNDNLERIEGPVEALRNRPGQFLWDHIIFMPMLILCVALLPLMAVYRLATLSLHSDVLVAGQQLETLWPEVQASWPAAVPLSRSLSLPVVYSLALALGSGATAGCFWLAGLETTGENWRIALYASGGILALVSFGMLIALIMTILGFEVEP